MFSLWSTLSSTLSTTTQDVRQGEFDNLSGWSDSFQVREVTDQPRWKSLADGEGLEAKKLFKYNNNKKKLTSLSSLTSDKGDVWVVCDWQGWQTLLPTGRIWFDWVWLSESRCVWLTQHNAQWTEKRSVCSHAAVVEATAHEWKGKHISVRSLF